MGGLSGTCYLVNSMRANNHDFTNNLHVILGQIQMEMYSEDIVFTFQSIMDDPIGENLRNLNAHGILEPSKGNGGTALCFLCLLIKFLMMYSREAWKIVHKLAEQANE